VTKAVGIQCRLGDCHNLIQLLSQTSETSTEKFVFYKVRHREPANYAKAIIYQSQYLDMARVVAIEGVPAIAMPEFAPFLQQRDPACCVFGRLTDPNPKAVSIWKPTNRIFILWQKLWIRISSPSMLIFFVNALQPYQTYHLSHIHRTWHLT
jgi:hypothetical protein